MKAETVFDNIYFKKNGNMNHHIYTIFIMDLNSQKIFFLQV